MLLWHDRPVTDDALAEVVAAMRALRRVEAAVKTRRTAVAAAVRHAAEAGVRQRDIVEVTGYTREHVRKLSRDDPGHHASS
jgi:uncharacterized protein YbgA (DUF1722 family)